MRKYVIGSAITLVFLAYSMILRNQHSGLVIAPASPSKSSSVSGGSSSQSSKTSSSTTSTSSTSSSSTSTALYKDGTYTGNVENAFYGNVQVSATISGGKITSVNFLQAPNDNPNSVYINQQADPYLKQEAIQSQNAHVSGVTGATFTSQAFIQSLSSALSQAKA